MRIVLVTLALCLVVFEGYARIFLGEALGRGTVALGMYRFDSTLGWNLNDGRFRHESKDFSIIYTTIDNHRRTSTSKPCEAIDIAVFGDSFVFGIGVVDEETIPSHLAKITKSCVSNEGVAGYGPDQYFLRWRKDDHRAKHNIFVIFTGNDYKDILGSTDAGGARKKPFLQSADGGYTFSFPSTPPSATDKPLHLFKSDDLIRFLAKQSPIAVALRTTFVRADEERVGAAVKRIQFLLSQMDRPRTLFVLMPSASLVRGISSATDEGLFREQVARLLESRGASYLDLYEQAVLKPDDYFVHEGHTQAEANARVASAIALRL